MSSVTSRWIRGLVVGAGLLCCVVAITAFVADLDDDEVGCRRTARSDWSVARHWNEAVLASIRLDFPAPTVHSRNLFHSSAGMWDAWAAYDDTATGLFVDEHHEVSDADLQRAREEAMSYAAYRILVDRYLDSPGAEESVTGLDELMVALCYDIDVTTTDGDSPAALGNRIAATILETQRDDGSNESLGYADPTYEPVNEPLVVAEPGTIMRDPNRWQPLRIEGLRSQTGQLLDDPVQSFVGPHWGYVTPFALPPDPEGGLPFDPGDPPYLGDPQTDAAFKASAVEVIRYSGRLDPASGDSLDIGPATQGANPLGTYDGTGYAENPVTGEPYAPNVVSWGDYGRVVAEFWADGPRSETPPGHWNTIANAVSDDLGDELRIGGSGPVVDRLEWDTKLYFALNGAVHDAAIAAWGAKGHYDYTRPIAMIRYMGGLGQSSDPDGPSYDPDGLPLEPGLVEVVTAESSAPGERHAELADHVGEIAIRAWAGSPSDPESEVSGVEWIRAVEWVPYQLPTFVTPAFAGYVSGHSTFSRAAAEVLTAMTGSEYFPGGLGTWTIPADSLEFEAGPAQDIELQWATYRDASDEAGISRLYGGIHVRADDLAGRKMGAEVGQQAWQAAQAFFAPPG